MYMYSSYLVVVLGAAGAAVAVVVVSADAAENTQLVVVVVDYKQLVVVVDCTEVDQAGLVGHTYAAVEHAAAEHTVAVFVDHATFETETEF